MGMPYRKKIFQNLKVAIVHDILFEYGGAERVLEELLAIFPKAALYTWFYNRQNPKIKSSFDKYQPRSSFFSPIPFLHLLGIYISVTKLFSWIYFWSLNLRGIDLVISSSHSYNSKIVRFKKPAIHISYIHTPPRYLYGLKNEIKFIKQFPFNVFFKPFFWFLRKLDLFGSLSPDLIVCNSKEVRGRIKNIYGRDSIVIYPPVKIPKKPLTQYPKKYYLFLSRLTHQKGAMLAVKTCTKYNLPLLVVGEGYLKPRLEKNAGNSVKFLGWVPDEKIDQIYAHSKALIYCAQDEDFGLVPVEAMAKGVPVIAYRSGGVKETVVKGSTGVLFDSNTEIGLYKAIKKFEANKINPQTCIIQASKFSGQKFKNMFREKIKFYYENKQ